ncbi:Protein of unknown function [Gryllus bimaculatus]|nr:Protein of unknown function [Gryllus bimaculatus]
MAVSLTMLAGQLGTVLGNVAFPLLLELDCELVFFLLGGIALGTALGLHGSLSLSLSHARYTLCRFVSATPCLGEGRFVVKPHYSCAALKRGRI